DDIRKYFLLKVHNEEFLTALCKADESGHLFLLKNSGGLNFVKARVIQRVTSDPFNFAMKLGLIDMKKSSPRGNGFGQFGSSRVNPNVAAAMEVPASAEHFTPSLGEQGDPTSEAAKVEKAARIKAREILLKSKCAQNCRKAG